MLESPNYDITRTIGSGAFGFVFEAIDRRTGKKVALKRVQKKGKELSRQNEMLCLLKGCPNIIQIEQFFYSQTDKGKLVQNMVFQYFEGNLQTLIQNTNKKQQTIPQPTIKSIIYQMLKGLSSMHEIQMAHRDIKPQNILLNKQNLVKICDFGCSKIIDPNGVNTPYVTSRYYRAPELILGISRYSVQVDLWAVGCLMAELVLGEPVFMGKDEGDQLFAILRVMGSFSGEEDKELKKRVAFEGKMFQSFKGYARTDLYSRLQFIKDKYFFELLSNLLSYLPETRLTAADALLHPYFKAVDLP